MTDKTILSFPIQKEDPNDERLTELEGVYQLKLKATAMLNEVAAGTYTLNTENIKGLYRVNWLCKEVGLAPLEFDIEALTSQ